MAYNLAQLAENIGAHVIGDSALMVSSIATLAHARSGQITFLSNSKYRSQLADTQASAVILHPDEVEYCPCAALVLDNPYVGFAKVAQLLDTTPPCAESIASSAVIDPSAKIAQQVSIGANAVIEADVELAEGVQIGAGCFVGRGSKIGRNSKLWANVTIYHNVIIGDDCLIQAGTVIGADGFGYANDRGQWVKIPQLGRVVLGNRVEIGASTTIDRGAIEDTVLEDGVIIDNQCQIAHNVHIGAHTAIAGCTVIAGSTRVGSHCTLAGLAAVNGHITIADNVHITGTTMVTKSLLEPGVYSSGIPATTNKEWRRNTVLLRNLNSMVERIKALEKSVK